MLFNRILIDCTKFAIEQNNRHEKLTKNDLYKVSVCNIIDSKISGNEFRPS